MKVLTRSGVCRTLLVGCLLLGLGISLAQDSAAPPALNYTLLQAEKLYMAGDYEQAEGLYKSAFNECSGLVGQPANTQCQAKSLTGLKNIYRKTQQTDKAILVLDKWVELHRQGQLKGYRLSAILTDRGDLYEQQGKLGLAIQDYRAAMPETEKESANSALVKVTLMKKLMALYERQGNTKAAADVKAQLSALEARLYHCMPTANLEPFVTSTMQKEIRKHWKPPVSHQQTRIVMLFRIFPDGSVADDIKLIQSNTDAVSDAAACNAIKKASPFPKMPKICADYVDIQFIFDYELYKKQGGS